jgi:preprotein translocase subunit SecE
MTDGQDSTKQASDTVMLAGAVVLAIGGVVAFYWLAAQALPLRLAALLVPLAVAGGIFSRTQQGVTLIAFLREVNIEVRKVVWPTRRETMQTTGVVFVAVIISAILLWGLDSTLAFTVKTLTGRGG